MIYTAQYPSPLGLLTLATDGEHITGLWMEGQAYFGSGLDADAPDGSAFPVIQLAFRWLNDYFSGANPSPTLVPLMPKGTPFQNAVWTRLQKIPYGQTVSYGELAGAVSAEAGKATSARAIGNAVGRNPISILIPCHRVVGADGRLTGYAGGLQRKDFLLRLEGNAIPLDIGSTTR